MAEHFMISTSTTNNIASDQVLTLFGQICSAQQSKKRAKKITYFSHRRPKPKQKS